MCTNIIMSTVTMIMGTFTVSSHRMYSESNKPIMRARLYIIVSRLKAVLLAFRKLAV